MIAGNMYFDVHEMLSDVDRTFPSIRKCFPFRKSQVPILVFTFGCQAFANWSCLKVARHGLTPPATDTAKIHKLLDWAQAARAGDVHVDAGSIKCYPRFDPKRTA